MAVVVSINEARLRAQQEETRRQACRCMTSDVHPQLKWGADGWRCSDWVELGAQLFFSW